ncbi:TetR/AcrR family transcriptional regulator [Xylanibacillus composti]|uniref:Putative HTH-type transcriptional regulator YwcC n=1 Tax=Xylanibacillus composti TaxID=1572762 RepID=A0A8J4H4F3_9BACL|nr:TetR/AcrR family transcriptional regulator [Xylanibacillus composti]MDT9724052.1 TetR/AcrR family transcriptional regulator [Xylanibacillus composti]GIQ69445.1 putative HTH-type transcriptional regulator YwcC [Xylanibacillus composti]
MELPVNKHQMKRMQSYDAFIQAALQVIAEKGYMHTSIEDIATTAGYSKAAFYVHFKSKDDFLAAFTQNLIQEFIDRFLSSFILQEDWTASVRHGIRLFIELAERDQWCLIFFEFYQIALRDEEVRSKLQLHYANWARFLAELLDKISSRNGLRWQTDSHTIASLIMALLDGYNLQRNILSAPVDAQHIEEAVIRLLRAWVLPEASKEG